jgi:hypothetical protein
MSGTKKHVLLIILVKPRSVLILLLSNAGKRCLNCLGELLGLEAFYDFLGAVSMMNIKIDNGYFPATLI